MAKPWAKSFYNSKAWRSTRQLVLHRDHYTCADCYGRAEEVHHIQSLTPDNINDDSIALNPDNLMCLCHNCHTKRTAGDDGDIKGQYCFDDEGNVVQRY